jgi:hypothetical protein
MPRSKKDAKDALKEENVSNIEQQSNPKRKPFDVEVIEWALQTYEEHTEMLIWFLYAGGNFKKLAFSIFELSGKGFPFNLEKFTEPQKIDLFYKLYSENWELFDSNVRFGDEYEQKWAMVVKMLALGMTYEEIIKDSKRRDDWTPLEQKRKGRW